MSQENHRFRRATVLDLGSLTALCLLSKQSNGYDDAFMAQCLEELRVRPDWLEDEFWLAETQDGELVGCARLRFEGSTQGEIATCFVHPDHHGKSIGRRLMNRLLESANCSGLSSIVLDADPNAVPFYEKMGFQVIDETPSGSIPGRFLPLTELCMSPNKDRTPSA
ncbi:N-acetylglutamate synthase-like GNAT family acetyltransferase [Roseibium hamelinense]|uniref:N-acetylglutamate synthase-like GNAT family acetyltransferase n=1 Tax=Roseibium hamelinense TaxID=150831 RepID=A0A562T9L0_9HYPH|nr:GNAT family N-acetyltransferase [Roseibium hamelinense]MTI45374.1 GNAT family N-acetyltransferase [Roseibium hamelinense]TWI90255.1 N-acetylglutamate synthase-like GNAT family acetyltransferase [Roseibium hamelinense]